MRTTPLVFKLWIFSYSVVGSRLTLPPLVAAPSPQGRRALGSCQSMGSASRLAMDWMTLPVPPRRRTHSTQGDYQRAESIPRRRTHSAHGLRHATENAGLRVGERRSSATVLSRRPRKEPTPDALRPGAAAGNGNAGWGLMKDAVRPGCCSAARRTRGTAGREVRSRTQPGPWLLCEPPPEGNCVAMVSVRSAVVADGPERVQPAVPLPVSANCAAAVWGSSGALSTLQPQR